MITAKQFAQIPIGSVHFFTAIAISRGLFDFPEFDNLSDEDRDEFEAAVLSGEEIPSSYFDAITFKLMPQEAADFTLATFVN